MSADVPEAFSAVTSLPVPKPGQVWDRRNRRPRGLIPGERANTPPVIKPGEKMFRVNPEPVYDPVLAKGNPNFSRKKVTEHREYSRGVIREWSARNGYGEVSVRGKIPAATLAAFMKQHDIWTVQVVSALLPGAKEYSQHFHIRQGGYTKKRTIYPHVVRRELGHEIYNMLWEVNPRPKVTEAAK